MSLRKFANYSAALLLVLGLLLLFSRTERSAFRGYTANSGLAARAITPARNPITIAATSRPSIPGDRRIVSASDPRRQNIVSSRAVRPEAVRNQEEKEPRVAKEPRPFHPESAVARQLFESLPVNTSLGEWRSLGPDNFGGKAYAVAVDPQNSQNVYAAYEVGGLWGTHDGGQTWLPLFNGFRNIAFSSVRIHPHVTGMVAAGLIAYGGGYFESFNKGVGIALSLDGGTTWKNIGPTQDPTASVWEIGFGDESGQVIYAPTDKGLYKTTNQGKSWTKILAYGDSNGAWPQFFNDRPSFAVDPVNPNVLLLAAATVGVMRSADAGSTWQQVDNWVDPTGQQNATLLSWSTANPNYVYAEAYTAGSNATLATYVSTDKGKTWTAGPTTSEFQQGMYDMAIASDPFSAGHVILHNTSLQYSTDGMTTLQDGTAPGPDCLAVTFDPSHPHVVYDGGDDGVFKSTDGGNTWVRFDTGVLTNKSVGGSLYAVGTDGKIYTNPADYAGQSYIPGSGWIARNDGYEYNRYYVNPHDPSDLYEMGGNGFSRAPTAQHPQKNIDPAPSESPSYNYLSVEFDPVNPETLYVGKQNLYKSSNLGQTWKQVGASSTFGGQNVYIVKVAPSNPKHLYIISGGDQLWSTTDAGTNWTSGVTEGGVGMMAISPSDENTVYIAAGDGLYQSTDAGQTAIRLPGFPNLPASWVMVDPLVPNQIYAALSNTGVLVSQDSGASWQQLGRSLPLVQVDWMSEVNGSLYAGTGASVWELNLSGEPVCSDVTLTPPNLVAASRAATYSFEVSISPNCSWSVKNPSSLSWINVLSSTTNRGHAIVNVALERNSANNAMRSGSLEIAGTQVDISQLGGPDPVTSDGTVYLSNNLGCLTVGSSNSRLQAQACTAFNPLQEFTLQPSSGTQYFVTNVASGTQCADVSNDALQIGAPVTAYPCTYGSNEVFNLQPQTSGAWWLVGQDSQLCLSVQTGGAVQQPCSTTNASENFSISKVSPSILLSGAPNYLAMIAGGDSTTSTLAVTDVSGYHGPVEFSATHLPKGITASFSPNPSTAGSTTLTLKADKTAQLGLSHLTVTGTTKRMSSSLTIGLNINSQASNAIQFIQVNANDATDVVASASSIAVPYLNQQAAGDLNIVVVGWEDATASISSVTDSNGNVYTLALGPTQSLIMPGTQAIYYASQIKAAPERANTVTVTFNAAAAYPDVRIVEYAGVSTLDASSANTGDSTLMASGSVKTAAAPELLFAADNMEYWTNNPGPGYTQRIQSAWGNIVEDEVVSAPARYRATAIQSAAQGWIMQMLTFK